MKYLNRELSDKIVKKMQPNKVVIVYGAKRVGKTVLVENILQQMEQPVLVLNGEDINVHDKLSNRSIENYKQIIGTNKLVYIDEAQKIPEISLNNLKYFESEIHKLKNRGYWNKQEIVDLFFEMIPEFDDEEKGKYLDAKM